MFTGIIEATGIVDALEPRHGDVGARLTVTTDLDVGALPLGASIAVDGVCLTIIERAAGSSFHRFVADLGPETLARTTLGALRPGARVHLERPLRFGDALGGHLVSGHVDGVGEVVSRREIGTALELDIRARLRSSSRRSPRRAPSPSRARASRSTPSLVKWATRSR